MALGTGAEWAMGNDRLSLQPSSLVLRCPLPTSPSVCLLSDTCSMDQCPVPKVQDPTASPKLTTALNSITFTPNTHVFGGSMCAGAMGHMWRSEGNLQEALLFPPICGSQGLNSRCQAGRMCFCASSSQPS